MSGVKPPVPPATATNFTIPVLPADDVSRRALRTSSSSLRSSPSFQKNAPTLGGLARRTLGIILLLVTVFLWTASNFLASTILADDSYSKPYFLTYANTGLFAFSLIPITIKAVYDRYRSGLPMGAILPWKSIRTTYSQISGEDRDIAQKPNNQRDTDRQSSLSASHELDSEESLDNSRFPDINEESLTGTALSLWDTGKLSLEFCILWFAANYFAAACLEYTTVASATILTSTSSIWTLIFGALPMMRVEKFTLKKFVGVLASMAGIILISTVDLSGDNDKSRGSFPHKSQKQIALGDVLALGSAAFYGFYTILMKKRIGDEGRVNMPLFFGLVGLFNVLTLWPGFIILHFTGEEVFQLPPTRRIVAIVLMNSMTSFVSDICWAYAMLLTSPLVVTVGLSLTIPLSLVGQMILDAQYSSFAYWIGAGIVLLSFVFINHESKEEDREGDERASPGETAAPSR